MGTNDGYPNWVYRSARIRRWAIRGPLISFWAWLSLILLFVRGFVPQAPLQFTDLLLIGVIAGFFAWWMSVRLFPFDRI
jgi:hypothetical protein